MKKVVILILMLFSTPALSQTNTQFSITNWVLSQANTHVSMTDLLSKPAFPQKNTPLHGGDNLGNSEKDEFDRVIEEIRAMTYLLGSPFGMSDDELNTFITYAQKKDQPEELTKHIEDLKKISDLLESFIEERVSQFTEKERAIAIYRNSKRLFKYDKGISEDDLIAVIGAIESNMTIDPRILSIRRIGETSIRVSVGKSGAGKGEWIYCEKENNKWRIKKRSLWIS